MTAKIQYADALTVLAHLEERILKEPGYFTTYRALCGFLGKNSASNARHIGQVASRIDAACLTAGVPFIGMHRIRKSVDNSINPQSFADATWRPHRKALVARAEAHQWSKADFMCIRAVLQSFGDRDSAFVIWWQLDQLGNESVQRALNGAG